MDSRLRGNKGGGCRRRRVLLDEILHSAPLRSECHVGVELGQGCVRGGLAEAEDLVGVPPVA